MFNQCCHCVNGTFLRQLHCTHTAKIFTRTLNHMMFFIKKAVQSIEEDSARVSKTGKSPEAEESVDEVEASSLYTAIVDMLYWKWRFFKIAFFPHCMPGAHLHYSSLRDLPDKFELSFCRSVHGT
ncbi:hypothetical protein T12_9226 [Trichinella patagoniensis]|uniref:Uncharacterized protein n=1 Tax=Trichinella patagoniensis TaxID=990121 RepID=A0A0V0YYC6_9BILA|nr:hypothetical protein T12_7966 [Trichinella patagoniensis]KRY05218.1 hypothetical protein T12_9226 [Trichinella patagoniensis]